MSTSLKLRGILLAIHPRCKQRGILAKGDKYYKDSISRSYYAFLDAGSALLYTKDIHPKSHAGTIHLFNLHFIKKEIVDEKYGRWFSKIEKARMQADYIRYFQEKDFTLEDAQEALSEAKEFVKMTEKILTKLPKEKKLQI